MLYIRDFRVTFSYVPDFTILVHFPIKHRPIVPRPLRSCARRRTPYNDSVKISIFWTLLLLHTTPRGLSLAVSPRVTQSSSFTFPPLTSAPRVLCLVSSQSAYKYTRIWLRQEPGNCGSISSSQLLCTFCSTVRRPREPAVPPPSF